MKRKSCIFVVMGILLVFSAILCIQIMSKNPDDKIGEYYYIETTDTDGEIIRRSSEGVVDEASAEENEWGEDEALVEEKEWVEDAEESMTAVREMMHAMDFSVEQPHLELTEEEDRAYREAFLRLLKNELPIEGWNEGEDCYQNLWWAGIPYENLLEERDSVGFPYSYYYDDIDGDGKPEFGVNQQAVYFFDYELGEEACSVSYCGQSIYFEKLLGVGKIWEHDGLHAWVERNRYIVLNSDGEWETVLDLELCFSEEETTYYGINGVDVGKENWEELTAPFYEAIEYEIPTKTLMEVFGELLEAD